MSGGAWLQWLPGYLEHEHLIDFYSDINLVTLLANHAWRAMHSRTLLHSNISLYLQLTIGLVTKKYISWV